MIDKKADRPDFEIRETIFSFYPALSSTHIPEYGGADRDRTDDLLNANQALSQLSYSPVTHWQPVLPFIQK